MAITTDDFNKIWASTSPLTPYSFSESQYKEGWNFIGGTPPSRQMWDFLQKQNDEKMQYLANNYLPLNGGTLTGDVFGVTPPNGDNSKKLATTEFVNAKAGNYLPLSGGTLTGVVNGVTPTAGDNSTKIATTAFVRTIVPAGVVLAYARGAVPTGWLLCDGSAVSRTDYAALYAVIGTTYGAGNGSTTFNLPNLTDKFIEGSATAGTVKSAGLPNITGTISTGGEYGFDGIWNVDNRGAFNTSTGSQIGWQAETKQKSVASKSSQALFDASLSNPVYGNSATVQPPSVTMRYIIKY